MNFVIRPLKEFFDDSCILEGDFFTICHRFAHFKTGFRTEIKTHSAFLRCMKNYLTHKINLVRVGLVQPTTKIFATFFV